MIKTHLLAALRVQAAGVLHSDEDIEAPPKEVFRGIDIIVWP